jgi:hypothetical protein
MVGDGVLVLVAVREGVTVLVSVGVDVAVKVFVGVGLMSVAGGTATGVPRAFMSQARDSSVRSSWLRGKIRLPLKTRLPCPRLLIRR